MASSSRAESGAVTRRAYRAKRAHARDRLCRMRMVLCVFALALLTAIGCGETRSSSTDANEASPDGAFAAVTQFAVREPAVAAIATASHFSRAQSDASED